MEMLVEKMVKNIEITVEENTAKKKDIVQCTCACRNNTTKYEKVLGREGEIKVLIGKNIWYTLYLNDIFKESLELSNSFLIKRNERLILDMMRMEKKMSEDEKRYRSLSCESTAESNRQSKSAVCHII